jgi:hypothetical protein
MLIPTANTLKNAFSGSFAYGDPRMQISRVQIPIANPHSKSTHVNKYCSKALEMNFMCIWSPRLQMVLYA